MVLNCYDINYAVSTTDMCDVLSIQNASLTLNRTRMQFLPWGRVNRAVLFAHASSPNCSPCCISLSCSLPAFMFVA